MNAPHRRQNTHTTRRMSRIGPLATSFGDSHVISGLGPLVRTFLCPRNSVRLSQWISSAAPAPGHRFSLRYAAAEAPD